MPTNSKVHEALERDVKEYLRLRGYLVGSVTYHESLEEPIKARLQLIDTLPALAVRNHADCVAVHEIYDSVFLPEFKSRISHRIRDRLTGEERWSGLDGFFEASQYAANAARSSIGAKILYCFRNEQLGLDVGFWSSDYPRSKVTLIHWPPRWRHDATLRAMLERAFPNASHLPVNTQPWCSSGDPYVVIPYDFLSQCAPWKELIDSELEQAREVVQVGPRRSGNEG